jgi:hypothetical protein
MGILDFCLEPRAGPESFGRSGLRDASPFSDPDFAELASRSLRN